MWYDLNTSTTAKACDVSFCNMQGAVSNNDTLWISTSYGRGNKGIFYSLNFDT